MAVAGTPIVAALMLPTNISALRVIFTDPQVAAVGLTPQAALGQSANTRAYDVPSSGTVGGAFYGAAPREPRGSSWTSGGA